MASSRKPLGHHFAARKKAIKDPLPCVYVFCEGAVTEPEYLDSFFSEFGAKKKLILKAEGGKGSPISIARICEKKIKELGRAARTDASYEANSSVWAVFDVDEHDYIDEVRTLAKSVGFSYVISNPCVEIWGLMHLAEQNAPLGRHAAQRLLSDKMPSYHHARSPRFDWGICKNAIKEAIRNGRRSVVTRAEEGSSFPSGNPSTNFYKLLQALVDNPERLWGEDKTPK